MFMGGKARIGHLIAADIAAAVPDCARRLAWEPFCGAGGVTAHLAPRVAHLYASDYSICGILLLRAIQEGWQPPTSVGYAEWKAARTAPDSALRGFIGYGCSFSGKWFAGFARGQNAGVKRNFAAAAARALAMRRAVGKGWGNVTFAQADYAQLPPMPPGAIVYCDPPYENTSSPGRKGRFDATAFWEWAVAMRSGGGLVFVSSTVAPPGWKATADYGAGRGMRGGRPIERLFT